MTNIKGVPLTPNYMKTLPRFWRQVKAIAILWIFSDVLDPQFQRYANLTSNLKFCFTANSPITRYGKTLFVQYTKWVFNIFKPCNSFWRTPQARDESCGVVFIMPDDLRSISIKAGGFVIPLFKMSYVLSKWLFYTILTLFT